MIWVEDMMDALKESFESLHQRDWRNCAIVPIYDITKRKRYNIRFNYKNNCVDDIGAKIHLWLNLPFLGLEIDYRENDEHSVWKILDQFYNLNSVGDPL